MNIKYLQNQKGWFSAILIVFILTWTGWPDAVAQVPTGAMECGVLGYTTYDWQSNCAARTWTHVWPDGKVNFAFTQASESGYADRGTGIGTYDSQNNEWIPSEGRIENEKTGFGSIAQYGANGLVVLRRQQRL